MGMNQFVIRFLQHSSCLTAKQRNSIVGDFICALQSIVLLLLSPLACLPWPVCLPTSLLTRANCAIVYAFICLSLLQVLTEGLRNFEGAVLVGEANMTVWIKMAVWLRCYIYLLQKNWISLSFGHMINLVSLDRLSYCLNPFRD